MVTNSLLTTPVSSTIPRTKYFPIEMYCANMLPNTPYDAFVNGTNVDAFCKPYGGNLGSKLISNAQGKLIFQYMMQVPYSQTYIVNPTVSNNNLLTTSLTLTLVDPFNRSSSTTLPLLYKSG